MKHLSTIRGEYNGHQRRVTTKRDRRGGSGATIRFAIGDCWLGCFLVAATDRGVCTISLGDNADALVRELETRFPRERLIDDSPSLATHVRQVAGLIAAPEQPLDLALDIRASAFQQQVWQALRTIPAGSPASYGEIAKRIGQPGAARAIARACSANPVAVAIPCHRVVGGDGALSGYRWGIERKRALLAREQAHTSQTPIPG